MSFEDRLYAELKTRPLQTEDELARRLNVGVSVVYEALVNGPYSCARSMPPVWAVRSMEPVGNTLSACPKPRTLGVGGLIKPVYMSEPFSMPGSTFGGLPLSQRVSPLEERLGKLEIQMETIISLFRHHQGNTPPTDNVST